jgi:hypothetical protein
MSVPDQFHYHEVLHLTSVFQETWNDHIIESEWIKNNTTLKNKANRIGELMAELYQDIGEISFDLHNKKIQPTQTPCG